MNEQQVDQIIDVADAIISGALAADPLLTDDDCILSGRYVAAVMQDRMPVHTRRSLHRMLAAAYSLGARHALERTLLTEIGQLADLYDDERVNLGTGEITTVGEDGANHE